MSLPGRVVRLDGAMAEVEARGRRRWCNALLVPEASPGDWVLTHTGLVVSVISPEDAAAVDSLLREAPEEVT